MNVTLQMRELNHDTLSRHFIFINVLFNNKGIFSELQDNPNLMFA